MVARSANAAKPPFKIRRIKLVTFLLMVTNTNSSNMNGTIKTKAKGHPNNPPSANQNTTLAVFNPSFLSMKSAIPNIVVYIAKVEGKKVAVAWNIPAERIDPKT